MSKIWAPKTLFGISGAGVNISGRINSRFVQQIHTGEKNRVWCKIWRAFLSEGHFFVTGRVHWRHSMEYVFTWIAHRNILLLP